MLTRNERIIVETLRKATSLRLVVNQDEDNEMVFSLSEKRPAINKVTGDIAVAVQDYFNRRKLQENNQ